MTGRVVGAMKAPMGARRKQKQLLEVAATDRTFEHIVPKNHGGTDDLENLAIACTRCNSEKGLRHDHKRADDPKLQEVIARLRERRRRRLR